jgi:uncharacterized phage-associated protein
MGQKQIAFEYVVFKLIEWYKVAYNVSDVEFNYSNDLSKLKVMKLLFFVTSANVSLLNTFNKFYAMPYGHVEFEVYNRLLPTLQRFRITDSKTEIIGTLQFNTLDPNLKIDIDNAIRDLQSLAGRDFIKLSAFQLVKLSHAWFSWKSTYSSARKQKLYKQHIPQEMIINERKFYTVNA